MTPDLVAQDQEPALSLISLLQKLHTTGPKSGQLLETLSLYKAFHPDVFSSIEEKIVASMGLFYKIGEPNSLYAFLIAQMGVIHRLPSGRILTPVQSSIRRALQQKQYVSISAPTSAGKSYSIREYIASGTGDAVVVVPSRALIAEYLAVMRDMFGNDKSVMVMPFVDRVFTNRVLRRIFVLTPERARDLFALRAELDVQLFFFDEAQISDEADRGPIFDVLVRRASKMFPYAKLVFAHPFVENPEAQFAKHDIPEKSSYSRSYPFGAVGKIFIQRHSNGGDYYFSPFSGNGHLLKNSHPFDKSFPDFAFSAGHSVLVYVTKNSIYNGSFLYDFSNFVDEFSELEDSRALEIISQIEELVGANKKGHQSTMVDLLRKGVVIHHGSVPLEVRFLIEDFVREKFARICFATSTLVQGVNMPFDIVWLDTTRILGENESSRALAFKNLIGRAGRLSSAEKFDVGYVYTDNPKVLIERLGIDFRLSDVSPIDDDEHQGSSDVAELLASIREGTFDEDLNVPPSKAERLSSRRIMEAASHVLDLVYPAGESITQALRGKLRLRARRELESSLRQIYEASLGRNLVDGESAVFREAVNVMIQSFQGRSFSEVVGQRFSYIARRDHRHKGEAEFSQQARPLPDIRLTNRFSIYPPNTPAADVSYDAVVFDTYDYLDQVISFSLNDSFVAAFKIHHRYFADDRALKFIELLRFGTNDSMHVMLMRYGFSPEDLQEVIPYVHSANETEIRFKLTIAEAPTHVRDRVAWFM